MKYTTQCRRCTADIMIAGPVSITVLSRMICSCGEPLWRDEQANKRIHRTPPRRQETA